jgi:hypothetical protein
VKNDEVFGFVRVKTTSIDISISNVTHNKNEIIKEIKIGKEYDAKRTCR